jgi:transcriptional regulator with XRE-family HTH domain
MKLNKLKEIVIEGNPEIGRLRKSMEANPLLRVGREIQRERRKVGMTQKELAKKMGTSQSAITKIENGVRNPSIKVLQKVADALDGVLTVKIKGNVFVESKQANKSTASSVVPFAWNDHPTFLGAVSSKA